MRWPTRTTQPKKGPAGRPLYLYRSTEKIGLNAFIAADDPSLLPGSHGPWQFTGRIASDVRLPHGLSRSAAEAAIRENGFALWRMKPGSETAA